MEVKPIITVENNGKCTRVKFFDIDISRALTNVSYSTSGKTTGENAISLEIDINGLLSVLSDITSEDIKNAREILAPYKESRQHLDELLSATPKEEPTE